MAIDPSRTEPVGDDQPWKRDQMRIDNDLIAALEALTSRVEQLERMV